MVLITGGSRGLGLVLARELALRGAKLAILARDVNELKQARASIHPLAPVSLVPADVTSPLQAQEAVDHVIRDFGRLDVLVNNAGLIVSTPFADTSDEDFEAALAVHFWGTLHMTRAALPYLERRPGARLVNICSVGGKIGVPHLSAYCASKFAQAGLSAVLTDELRQRGITVTTVFPGLMRTGSHRNARFKGHARQEFAAFALANGLPGTSMGAERAARQILYGVARGSAELVIPLTVRQLTRLSALLPNQTASVMSSVNRLLPSPRNNPGAAATRGADIPMHPVLRTAIGLSESAASRHNELA